MLTLLLLTTSLYAAQAATRPSSHIPEKRQFEVSPNLAPCEDFHRYVCSNVEASFKLRPDRSSHTFAFNDSGERLLEVRKKFTNGLPSQKNLDPRTEQIRDLYLSCMNGPEKAREEKALVTQMVTELSQIESPEELIRYSNSTTEKGFGNFISLFATNNLDDSDKIDGALHLSLMQLPDHKYYEQKALLKDYEKLLTSFFMTIEPKLSKKAAITKAQNVISLEKDFIKVYPITAIRHQRWSEKRVSQQSELLVKYPNLHLEILFENVPKNVLINTPIPESLEFLNGELSKRPIEIWKDVYLVRALQDQMDDAYQKFFKQGFEFEKKYFGGPDKRADRRERCTNLITSYFNKEIDAALIDQVFPNFDETKLQEVGRKIRESIVAGLEANSWLSKDGKKEALRKISTARLQLVKPHTDREWDFLPLRKYEINHYVENLRTYSSASWEKTLKELREPANKDAWGMGPLTVNAYYSSSENKFVLPIGILQYPFYDKDGSVIENLGAVGAVIGHELGHSIDDSGSKYDSKGRLKQWMTTKDIMEFNLRGQKLIDQFNQVGHDGKLTLGENVADLVGLTFAYNAAFPKGQGLVEDKKKFFTAYGRLWCSVTRPDYEKMMRKTNPHSAGWARINEQIKHQPGFAEAFQCKAGDKMTLPESNRIRIW